MIAEAGTIAAPPAPPADLVEVIAESGTTGDNALVVQTGFTPFYLQVAEWQAKIATVTDPKVARASRLMLRKIRVEAEHKKDEIKADALKFSKAVDSAYRRIRETIEPMESALQTIETQAEREAAAQRAALVAKRTTALQEYGVDCQFFALGDMPEEHFAKLLEQSRLAHEAKIAAEARAAEEARIAAEKAEQERIARENAAAEERERMRLENERLKREAAEREEAARKERERIAAERKAEEERKAAELKAHTDRHYARMKVLAPYLTAAECMSVPLLTYSDASDEQFAAIVTERKAQHEERARLAKEAAEREAAAKAERARIEAESAARLAEERRKAEEARRISEENARKEREAREIAEKELRRQAAEKAAREKAEREAAERAAAAPDREKLLAFAATIRAVKVPEMASMKGKAVMRAHAEMLASMANAITREAGEL